MTRVLWSAVAVFVLLSAPLFAVDLWDNGPLITTPGGGFGGADVSELQTLIGGNILGYGHQISLGNRVADDFTIADAGGWHIDEIIFFAYQTGSSINSTITDVDLNVWDGRPGDGGEILVGNGVFDSTSWSGIYRAIDTDPLGNQRPIMAQVVSVNEDLGPGTYWLDWATDGTLGSGPWAPPVTFVGQGGSGNARQFIAQNGTWGDLFDDEAGWQDDLPFIVRGSVIPEPATLMLLAMGGLVAVARRRK